jgi:FixJ family two-component response regulator
MPGMSGTELAGLLRVERPSIKVLIVSGYAEVDGIAPDLPRLTKPFRSVDLASSLTGLSAPSLYVLEAPVEKPE